MSAVAALGHHMAWVVATATALVVMAALLKGGPAERGGAVMVAVAWTIILAAETLGAHGFVSLWVVSVPMLITDFLLSFGLLLLALRYASLWLGVAMLAQSAQLALHAFYIAAGGGHAHTFAVGSNVSSAVLLAAILVGTLSSWRKRTQAARLEANALL